MVREAIKRGEQAMAEEVAQYMFEDLRGISSK